MAGKGEEGKGYQDSQGIFLTTKYYAARKIRASGNKLHYKCLHHI